MGYRSFIFDVGNVLLRWSPADILRTALTPGKDVERYARGIFANPRWLNLDRGDISQDFAARQFASELDCSEGEILHILRVGQESLLPMAAGINLLNDLHEQGRDLVCLTNMSRETYDLVRAKFDFWTQFRCIVVSGHVRMAKPEPAIFTHTLQACGLDARSTVLIDDHLPNLESARLLGIVAVQYDESQACLSKIRKLADLE